MPCCWTAFCNATMPAKVCAVTGQVNFVGRSPGVGSLCLRFTSARRANPGLISFARGLAHSHSLGPHGPSALPNSFRHFPNGSSRRNRTWLNHGIRVDSLRPQLGSFSGGLHPRSFHFSFLQKCRTCRSADFLQLFPLSSKSPAFIGCFGCFARQKTSWHRGCNRDSSAGWMNRRQQ